QCWSNGRQKGENNAKCGNRYLAWAFVEAANYAAHSYRQAQVFVERKTAQVNRALAIKALANKLCRASYWVMKEQVKFEPARLFGS
ncbi:MAG: IS110 family transposase, partial [Acidobacteria bacterium]|nr:IS110 family transposase [Acidobacteriota bacterium]